MSKRSRKNARIKRIMEDAAAALEAEGVRYFIGVVDRTEDPVTKQQIGDAFTNANLQGDDFCYILEIACQSIHDLRNLAIYVAMVIKAKLNISNNG